MLSKPRNAPFTARMGFDPSDTDVGVQIIDYPAVITARVPATEIAPGVWEAALTAPGTAGDYAVLWDADGDSWRSEDLVVTSSIYSEDDPEPEPAPTTDLISVEQYKLFNNIDLDDTTNDAAIEQMISMVSAAILRLTDRDFGSTSVLTTRTYDYNGGGVVNIDDCSEIISVALDGNGLVDADFAAQPRNEPVYFYLDLFTQPGYSNLSPEMNFTRNMGVYGSSPVRTRSTVEVEALFGWPEVPADVALAALHMVDASLELPKDEVSSESIAEYSYSNAEAEFNSDRWPRKAADLLRPYRRINM